MFANNYDQTLQENTYDFRLDHLHAHRLDCHRLVMFTTLISIVRSAMVRHPEWFIIGVLAAALAVSAPLQQRRVRAAQQQAAATALRAGNLLAERDSTRNAAVANARVAALLGDSVRLVEKRVQQVVQRRDQLDRALGGERRARYALAVTVDSLRSSTAGVLVTDASGPVQRAEFNIRQPPYTVAAVVEIPQRPDTARLAMRIALDPLPIVARVMCSAPDAHGVRAASVVVSSPPWATLRLARLEQSPAVCGTAAPPQSGSQSPLRFSRLVVGVGVVGRAANTASLGWFVGTGFAIRS